MTRPTLVSDDRFPSMWRIRWPDGEISDMVNLSRAKDAARCWVKTEVRSKQKARKKALEAPLVRFQKVPATLPAVDTQNAPTEPVAPKTDFRESKEVSCRPQTARKPWRPAQ